jgi:caffeoyl-CoA O-methyltransferase
VSKSIITMSDELYAYLLSVSLRETEVQRRLREETATLERHRMQISPDQGQLMALLVRLLGARRVVEVGVFTGYSALAVAAALPPDGRLIACDVSEEWTSIARRYWSEAGVDDRIDLRLAPAMETLDRLLADEGPGSIDLAFLDADKESYDGYYERVLELLRPGGLVLIDNVLWGGKVMDEMDDDPATVALRALNLKLHGDTRVDLAMIPVGDGLTLARKR